MIQQFMANQVEIKKERGAYFVLCTPHRAQASKCVHPYCTSQCGRLKLGFRARAYEDPTRPTGVGDGFRRHTLSPLSGGDHTCDAVSILQCVSGLLPIVVVYLHGWMNRWFFQNTYAP